MDKRLLFLLSHQPNPRFIKQIRYFSNACDVFVACFSREYMQNVSNEYIPFTVEDYNLGVIVNKRISKRIKSYFTSAVKYYRSLKVVRPSVIVVNNIDVLLLHFIVNIVVRNNSVIVMEISDLREHAYSFSIKSFFIALLEKHIFRLVDKLIVTSPMFYDSYYRKLYHKKHFVLENKPLSDMMPLKLKKIKNKKVVIGIVGLLLQEKPYRTLFDYVKFDDSYEVHVYGCGLYQYMVEEFAGKYENIKYFGAYNFFEDSAKIYSSLDVLYMPYDTTNNSVNNRIALPNKLYEAMYYKVIVLTSLNTYLGEIVEKYKIGITVKCCDENDLIKSLRFIESNKDFFLGELNNIDEEKYLADKDYFELSKYLELSCD